MGRVDAGSATTDFLQGGATSHPVNAARYEWNNTNIVLVDTPGHVDFGFEVDRTLSDRRRGNGGAPADAKKPGRGRARRERPLICHDCRVRWTAWARTLTTTKSFRRSTKPPSNSGLYGEDGRGRAI